MGNFFGTDGVRGIANTELTPLLAFNLGRYGAHVLTAHLSHKPCILVGKDTRVSGDMLEAALVAGILSAGAHAHILGVVPTPAVAFLTRKYNADAGIVISASHNAATYNGIKFFNSQGFKLSDSIENEIEAYIEGKKQIDHIAEGDEIGRRLDLSDRAADDYIAFITETLASDLSGMRIAIDCAQGAASFVAPEALRRLGADVSVICDEPDGMNINDNCGSTHTDKLRGYVLKNKADVGIAFDGDADRLIAVDENGDIIDGDRIMGLLAYHMKEEGTLKGSLVATVMSNLGLFLTCGEWGIDVIQTKVGDRYVLEEMLEKNCNLGGEQSGHIIFLDKNTTGDGLLSAVQFLSLIKKQGKRVSELAKKIPIYPQVLINVTVPLSLRDEILNDTEVLQMLNILNSKYNGQGRVLLRPSGTEPLIRIMIEGKDQDEITIDAKKFGMMITDKFCK